MIFDLRTWLAYGIGGSLIAITVWALSFPPEPRADFAFINNLEVKSLDPAIVTGLPEGRVLQGIFEGLTSFNPKTLVPQPGIAERWDISEDRLRYTFHLRPNAKWSDGSRITAHDIVWAFRRFIDPLVAGQYSYQMWYVKNAKRYTTSDINVGEPVEIELQERPDGALPFARGKLLHGKLLRSVKLPAARPEDVRTRYFVEIDGKVRAFVPGSTDEAEGCQQVLLDFQEVGIKALDDSTIEYTLTDPTPYFLSLLAFYPSFPVQPKCVETHGYPEWTKAKNLVTSGAFRLHSRRIRDRIRLVKSDTYWDRENVDCETIDVLAVESQSTGLNLYLTGEVDWIPSTTVPLAIVPELLAQKRDDFDPKPELSVNYYRLNVTKPPLDNKLVRQALAMAIDKKAIVETVTRAGEVPARSFVPIGMPDYTSPQAPAYNPEEAKRLLAKAGFPDGKGLPKLPILFATSDANQAIAELIQDQWKRTLGVSVAPQNQPWGSYLASVHTLNYTTCQASWVGDYVDPNTFLDMFVTEGANNETGWGNDEYDRLIADAARELDSAKRMQLFEKAEAILLDEAPIIPLFYRSSKNMVRPYVGGLYLNLLDTHPLKWITVDKAARTKFLSGGFR